MEPKNTEEEVEMVASKRNQTWQNNHIAITKAIDFLMRENERIPTQQEIATQAGLRRQTVCEHLKEFKQEKMVFEDLEQVEFMASKVLAKVLELAMDGDMKASRLSLQLMGLLGRQPVYGREKA
jgi:hypothetical protein